MPVLVRTYQICPSCSEIMFLQRLNAVQISVIKIVRLSCLTLYNVVKFWHSKAKLGSCMWK